MSMTSPTSTPKPAAKRARPAAAASSPSPSDPAEAETAAAETPPAEKPAAKAPAKKTPVRKTPAKKTPAKSASATTASTTERKVPAAKSPARTTAATTAKAPPVPRKRPAAKTSPPRPPATPPKPEPVELLRITDLTKRYGSTVAVDAMQLSVPVGCFYGIVGPNGAGKSTTLLMAAGLLRPDEGSVTVAGDEVWARTKKSRDSTVRPSIGVMPDRMRLFDRLTGRQLLHYSAVLHGLGSAEAVLRSDELIEAFGLADAANRLIADYSAGMTKKIALATAMIHTPKLLVLDEPFESVDPVSASILTEILKKYVAGGGTVLFSSHSIEYVEKVCDRVAVIVDGVVLSQGTMSEVRAGTSLRERFVALIGGPDEAEGMEWLQSSSE